MVDILHRVGVAGSSPKEVYAALTTVDVLAEWWTEDTAGSGGLGGTLEFRFPPVGGFDMEVLDLLPGEHVKWRVTDGPEEWVGTTITWDIRQDAEWTIVLFAHEGWKEKVEFMSHCSTKWGSFLMSLKALLETGKGSPPPGGVQIGNWH